MPDAEIDSPNKALIEVWHSFGLIQNEGFHSYLCSIGDEALSIAKHYEIAGLPGAAKLIIQAHGLWRRYWQGENPDQSDPDEFRSHYGDDLDGIESDFYGLEDQMQEALAKIVRTISPET